MKNKESVFNLLLSGSLLCAVIFISDIFTPLGIADGISYIVVVLLTLWYRKKEYTITAAILCSVLTLIGIFFSPEGEKTSIYITNRFLSLLAIWSAAYAILRFSESEKAAEGIKNSLNALFTNANVGIIIATRFNKITMANPMAATMAGYAMNDMKDMNLEEIFPGLGLQPDATMPGSEYNSGIHGSKELELNGRTRKGTSFPAEVRRSFYQLNGVDYQIIFMSDISERKRHEEVIKKSHEELKLFAKQLKETNAELENFAFVSSHDLQEPLRKIQSFGDRLLHSENDKLSEKGTENLTRILNAAERMQRLINDLLSLSRLTSKAKPFEPVNLGVILEEVIADLEVSIKTNNARIKVLNELPVIMADPTQMRQLFQNIIANAIKFRKADEDPVIKIHSVQTMGENGQMLKIVIDDNGIGFDEKYIEKIFVIFQRLESNKYPGSGIGLAICKKIVQRHKGTISAKSLKGEGSSFTITLPFNKRLQTVPVTENSNILTL